MYLQPNADDQSAWIDACTHDSTYVEPKLTVILSMNQPTIEQVLEYLVEHLEEQKSVQPGLGRWLYALLAALELPLNPDICSCLRSLARTCSTMRSLLVSFFDYCPLYMYHRWIWEVFSCVLV